MGFTMPALRKQISASLAVCLLLAGGWAMAQADAFRVRALTGVFDGELLYAEARIDYRLTATVQQALENGVALVIAQELRLEKPRWWWRNARLVELDRRYRLQYHAISRRYVMTWLASGDSRSFRTLDALLQELGRIEAWPVTRAERLTPETDYELRLQSRLEVESLPRLLRTVALTESDWQLESQPWTAVVER